MNCLCFDTSGEKGCVAVVKDGKISGSIELSKIYGHNETLLPSAKILLDRLSLTPQNLNVIGFVRGPGSFTGLRIGIATAYGIGEAVPGIELKGYTSLFLFARRHIKEGKNVLVLLDARKKQVYAALFTVEGKAYGYKNMFPEGVSDFLSNFKLKDIVITGNGYLKYRELFNNIIKTPFVYRESEKCLATALAEEVLSSLGIEKPDITPLYIRKSDAEVNRDKKAKQS